MQAAGTRPHNHVRRHKRPSCLHSLVFQQASASWKPRCSAQSGVVLLIASAFLDGGPVIGRRSGRNTKRRRRPHGGEYRREGGSRQKSRGRRAKWARANARGGERETGEEREQRGKTSSRQPGASAQKPQISSSLLKIKTMLVLFISLQSPRLTPANSVRPP